MKKNTTDVFRRRTVAGLVAVTVLLLLTGLASAGSLASLQQIPRDELKPRTLPSKSIVAAVGRADDPRTLIVKLRDDARIDVRGGRFVASEKAASAAAERLGTVFAKSSGARIERAITVPKPLLDAMRHAGELATGEQLADLSQFYVVRVPAGQGIAILGELLALDDVENAYAYRAKRLPVDVPPTTPDFLNNPPGQGYRGPAPAGIDIDAAWAQGFRGEGVTVVDVETNWNLNHEDLGHLATQTPAVPIIPKSDWRDPGASDIDHGTATLGVLAAGDNGYGASGLVPAATIRVVPIFRQSDPLWIAPHAVVAATLAMNRGDVMLLEVENPQGEPFETFDVEYAVVRQATALGIHVIEPAGNSPNGFSLDISPLVLDPVTGMSKFDWRFRDSGAIVVAGGESAVTSGVFHYRYVNSNCGSRVDAFAWGHNITTLGYGPLSSTLANCANPVNPFPAGSFDANQWYTFCYNGTSGAGAIVAGAVAALEQKHEAKWGRPASVREMRNHLRLGTVGSTFTANPSIPICQGGIGHQPDMAYHIDLFDKGGIVAQTFNAEWRADSFASVAEFGSAIASPGDVDGDGLADIAIGAPGYWVQGPPALQNAGRVYLFSAKSNRILWAVNGTASHDGFGQTLAALGDVNNDGIGDLAAGAPWKNGNRGAVRVLSGATGATLYTLNGTVANEAFGAALSAVNDVDGDGMKDLVVGVPGLTASGITGRIELRSGNTGSPIWSEPATEPDSEFGFAVAGTGDIDGDGYSDVIVGEPRYEDPATNMTPGAISIRSGLTGDQIFFLRGEIPFGTFNNSRFGAAVAGTGDLTSDGIADFVVGAPGWTQTIASPAFGKVYIYGSNGQLLKAYTGAQKSDQLGSSVAGGFDWNGDGKRDVAAGQPGALSGVGFPPTAGKVFIYQGPFKVLVQQAPITEAAVSAPIVVRPVGPTTKVFPTKDTGTSFGTAVAVLGDTNGDGLPDIGAGEPDMAEGRAFVFASGPAPAVVKPKLVAELPAIEAFDVDGNGFGGGGLSPSQVKFHLNASPAWAGADYLLIGVAKPPFASNPTAQALVASGSPYLIAATGTLDGSGQTSAPRFGPIQESLLCPGLRGAELDFTIFVGIDANNDGIYEQITSSNVATVTIIHEYYPNC